MAPRAGKKAPAKTPAAIPDLPAKISEVAKWLAARGTVDAATLKSLGRRPKQKAAEMAAAIRALAQIGTSDALEVIATYRPPVVNGQVELEGRFGDTFADPVTKEILAAWSRFDRWTFAGRIFSDFGLLWIAHGGAVDDLTGIGAARGLRDLRMMVSPQCDLSPLAACVELKHLAINVHGRTGDLAPLARVPALEHLAIINGDKLEQVAVDAIAEVKLLKILSLSVGPTIDFKPLTRLPALQKVKLSGSGRTADARTVAALSALLKRGVDVYLYEHEAWARDLVAAGAIPGVTSAVQAGFVGLSSDPARAEAMRSGLSVNALFM